MRKTGGRAYTGGYGHGAWGSKVSAMADGLQLTRCSAGSAEKGYPEVSTDYKTCICISLYMACTTE